jgi:hypothetical protein
VQQVQGGAQGKQSDLAHSTPYPVAPGNTGVLANTSTPHSSSWPCKVSFEIHINGRRVSELVHEDKGKTTATELEDEKDPKRARVVLSKGRELVGPGDSRLTGAATKVTDIGENLGNPSPVNRVSKTEHHYLSRVSRVG